MWFAGDRAVRYAVEISELLGIRSFSVGFVIMSVSTGLPELATTVLSKLSGASELSAGNIVGSNLVNLTLVLGASAILAGSLELEDRNQKVILQLLALLTLLASTLYFTSSLNPLHGAGLILLYFATVAWMSKTGIAEKIVKEEEEEAEAEIEQETLASRAVVSLKLLGSLALVILSGEMIVSSSIGIGSAYGVPLEVIGATAVAVGTGLPELTLELNAVKRREYGLAMGDIFGSTLVNFTLILGILAALGPGSVDLSAITPVVMFLMAALATVWSGELRKSSVGRIEGAFLLAIFAVYLAVQALLL